MRGGAVAWKAEPWQRDWSCTHEGRTTRSLRASASIDEQLIAAQDQVEERQRSPLRKVINATGIVLHTNLGRVPLAMRARLATGEIATHYSGLAGEGGRRPRHRRAITLLRALTGGEDAALINDQANAVLLALAALAAGREVIVARGDLCATGGGSCILDLVRASGARPCVIGSYHRARLRDYLDAVDPATALVLRVHRSRGTTSDVSAQPPPSELHSALGKRGVPVMVVLGTGTLTDLRRFGLPSEPTVRETLAAGASLCCFPGDKLLGGPPAGLLCGRAPLVQAIRTHALARALRPDDPTVAALLATLASYHEGNEADEIPVLRMLGAPARVLGRRRKQLRAALERLTVRLAVRTFHVRTAVARSALPGARLETLALGVKPQRGSVARFARRLARGDPAVVARVHAGWLLVDLRTVTDDDIELLALALVTAAQEG